MENRAEERAYHRRITNILRELIVDFQKPSNPKNIEVYDQILRHIYENGPQNYFLYQKPPWMNDKLLTALVGECNHQLRAVGARSPIDPGQICARVGEVAIDLGYSTQFIQWMRKSTDVEFYARPTILYLRYEEQDDFVDIHVDRMEYAVSALICIEHILPAHGDPSSTVFIHRNGEIQNIAMRPGESVVFAGGSVPHGRTSLQAGEAISLLIFGFRNAKTAYDSILY